jgi:asparagine synthase (glutamine-hydrolysing)
MGEIVGRMTESLRHRGPDDGGTWVNAESGAALGHRRLAIVDLSAAGKQPMASRDGRYVLSFNGEIYNHDSLRRELHDRGVKFRGGSDTEVIIEACSAWSPRLALERLHGMFAVAIWDRTNRELILARDRLGIKPLYWSANESGILFASELKALRKHPDWHGSVSPRAVAEFLRYGYVRGPDTIHEGVRKLQGGEVLTWSLVTRAVRVERFWDLCAVASCARQSRVADMDPDDAIAHLHRLLADAVRSHMVADVPLGAFLSGGVDSSTVVALMQVQSDRPVRTFSIGFETEQFDEAPYARAVAKHLGTDHTELYVSGKHAIDLIPRLPEWYDEPFADSSQIPTYLVCDMTRKHVTVALSGDGGDELFGGYPRYDWTQSLWRWMGKIPAPIRASAARVVRTPPARALARALCVMPGNRGRVTPYRVQRLADALDVSSSDELYRQVQSIWINPSDVMLQPRTEAEPTPCYENVDDLRSRMQLTDTLTYLPDDILTKVDRASMAVSLEARVPLLDHRVVEFAWALPVHLNTADGRGKFPLRRILAQYVPSELIDRPKQGFGVPLGDWLRGPLRPWAESLLTVNAISNHGLLNPEPVRSLWREHVDETQNAATRLWPILMLQAWLAHWQS